MLLDREPNDLLDGTCLVLDQAKAHRLSKHGLFDVAFAVYVSGCYYFQVSGCFRCSSYVFMLVF